MEINYQNLRINCLNYTGDDYLSSMKKTRDQLTLDLLPNAIKRVKSSLIIREISIQEKIEISAQRTHFAMICI